MWKIDICIENDNDFSYDRFEENIQTEIFKDYKSAFERLEHRIKNIYDSLSEEQHYIVIKYKQKLKNIMEYLDVVKLECLSEKYDIENSFDLGNWIFAFELFGVRCNFDDDKIQIFNKKQI